MQSVLLLIYLIPNYQQIKGSTESSLKVFGGVKPKESSHLVQMMVILSSGTLSQFVISLISIGLLGNNRRPGGVE